MTISNFLFRLILALSLIIQRAATYNTQTCCNLALNESQFIGPVPDTKICGQSYSSSLPAAEPLYVSYAFCSERCSGIELSKGSDPNQWAASIVQFILPSVIFSMTIPRRKKIEFDYLFEFQWPRKLTRFEGVNDAVQLVVSLFCFAVILIPVTIDSIMWIAGILVGAGNMIVGGLYEAHLDYRIVKYVKDMGETIDEEMLTMKRELLVTITSGNLMLDKGRPLEAITRSIGLPGPDAPKEGKEKARSRLLNLLGAQTSFGSAVGSPVLFYLGAFVYTILDLRNDPSSEDSAISLGFGIEWMVIVHVAIVSGCLLASNNPSTSSGIVGSGHEALDYRPNVLRRAGTLHSHRSGEDPKTASHRERKRFYHLIFGWSNAYDTEFQPVSLWGRGSNKMQWIKQTQAYKSPDGKFKELMKICPLGWVFKILLPALTFIVLPPASGAVVAFFTPPRGMGCRSLSCTVYACCQIVITILATIRCAVDDGSYGRFLKHLFTGWRFIVLSSLFWFGSLISAVGGMTMQTIGVYRNCVCYAISSSWWNIKAINPMINLATDTQAARDSSVYWIWMGSVATVFMAITTYMGWWYQKLIRRRFTDAVKEMFEPDSIEGVELRKVNHSRDESETLEVELVGESERDKGRDSMTVPLLRMDSARSWATSTVEAIDPVKLSPRVEADGWGSTGEVQRGRANSQAPLIRVSLENS
ncbi:hypothetical protein EG329_002119 [Mollisiaceae sp. DMI_Dod_QoI]|nr:hypothetical protein EG329_002119 [Helotiales sp. DMI_Dod_QoI]